ncbi:MAG: hypothetical protein H8E94_05430, partial [Alphaproteobacteria bacterium]|nr:hypothetical protein [Alphaproteobacteria bacterium]
MIRTVMIVLTALFVGQSAIAAVDDPGVVRVNSVVVAPAASVAQAEAAAKREALQRVIGMRGNLQIRDADVQQILSEVDGIVQTRHVLNGNAVGGRYQPAFYFNVGMDRINEIIQQADAGNIAVLGSP